MVSVFRFLFLLFLCSCSVGDQDMDMDLANSYQIQGIGYRFVADRGKYQALDFNRKDASLCQVGFEIKSIKRQGNELTLEIERPKGCKGFYELVWDGTWQESAPRRMQIYLTGRFAACTGSSEVEIDQVKVDLATALQDESKDLFTIYVREHCGFRDFNCIGNCDLKL